MSSLSVSAARAALPEVLDRVIGGEEIVITRYGRPVAVVIRPESLRVRRADHALASAGTVRELLEEGRRAGLAGSGDLSVNRAEELIAEIRIGRERA